ncbi:DUF4387 domain-containing protein [Variovorax sp. KK3]|uniref:DUF4387 domain-containing protein n=1 Tax=Variovorax sp. KK3 TaxID=1855728 RepID=UPI00097C36E0|nr:DUF4387 domain-containing protein [Variovorax sp. KK3]
MPKLAEVCTIRSKNAGPFWITVDLFFPDDASYERYAASQSLAAAAIAAVFGVDPAMVRHFRVDALRVLKISYPRRKPQGGAVERDMHGGQQYVQLLGLEL